MKLSRRLDFNFSSDLSAQNASKSMINCLVIKSVWFQQQNFNICVSHIQSYAYGFQFQ